MKQKILMLLLAFVMLLSGCVGPLESLFSEKNEESDIVLYFANEESTDLIGVSLDIDGVSEKDLPAFVMEKLFAGPTSTNLRHSVRIGTKLLSISRDNNQVNVDVSKEFYNEKSIYDILAMAAIVKSLCSIPGVDSVLLTVEGQQLESASGELIGVLKETDVVFDADALATDESNVTLYFSDLNAEYLVREIRRVEVPRGETVEKIIVKELINGPEAQTASRIIPKETKIRSVETKEGVCFVNLSSEFVSKNNVGTSAERLTIYSIVNALTELSNIDKVQFLIEGEKRETYHHVIFNEPIERDVSMIQK